MSRNPKSPGRALRWLETLLGLLGCAALAWCLSVAVQSRQTSVSAATLFQRPSSASEELAGTRIPTPVRPNQHRIIGRLEVPQLDISAAITSGIDTEDLVKGVGHVPGTAMPGGLGTMGLAAHRDTYFRPLQRIHSGMEIKVSSLEGSYRYSVDSTEIVRPEQVEVVAIHARPELSLITCYPFHYIGAAPRRFIVHAHLVSLAAD